MLPIHRQDASDYVKATRLFMVITICTLFIFGNIGICVSGVFASSPVVPESHGAGRFGKVSVGEQTAMVRQGKVYYSQKHQQANKGVRATPVAATPTRVRKCNAGAAQRNNGNKNRRQADLLLSHFEGLCGGTIVQIGRGYRNHTAPSILISDYYWKAVVVDPSAQLGEHLMSQFEHGGDLTDSSLYFADILMWDWIHQDDDFWQALQRIDWSETSFGVITIQQAGASPRQLAALTTLLQRQGYTAWDDHDSDSLWFFNGNFDGMYK